MSNYIGHFRTVTRHRHMVIRHCFRAGIFWQGLFHDLSKYSPTEFMPGAKYYTGHSSPCDGERKALGYSRAWVHHMGRNKHHFEYWHDYENRNYTLRPVKMPLKYVVEMLCDRMAASKTYYRKEYSNEFPLNYLIHDKSVKAMHPETYDFLHKLLVMLSDKGEEYTFKYVKSMIRNREDY